MQVPVPIPVTTPVVLFIDSILPQPLLQFPPVPVPVRVDVPPTHADKEPEIVGVGLTVTMAVARQPDASL